VIYVSSFPTDEHGENEIIRFIRTPLGLYRISYTQKNGQIDEKTKEKWLKIIKEGDILKLG
jgi:hypothetical protein